MWIVRVVALLWLLLLPASVLAQDQVQEVRVGLFVSTLSNIDFADGSFRIGADAWFVHRLDEFDPTKQLEVSARQGQIEPIRQYRLPDGTRYEWVRLQAQVDHDFTFDRFPFDRQTLRLVIEAVDPVDRLRLVPDVEDTRIGDLVAITGWDVTGWRLEEGQVSYDTEFGFPGKELRTYSRIVLTIDVARQRTGMVIDKFLGFTMAFLVSMLIYLMRTDQFGVRVGMAGGAIFAVVGNRTSLDAVLGSDNRLGLVDQLTVLVFASILTSLIVSLVVFHLKEAGREEVAWRVNRIAGVTALVVFPLLAAIALGRAHGWES
ncbi:MAG TPA: hypothetical protein VHL31_08340 [Geminicoccus sp.]|jgi:hypothetical protein|uniref:hypothetical protein n=1 Tax=Geminicoccus sp. TaxID=2024832 RepID=UPI002E349BE1|nr:hypothetical protein [Geminicoccus sp.]HEX2526298.1 hypothetical protein [Geminicoccus sp.]